MQREFAVIVDDGMACVGAALESDNNIGGFREQIGHFALSLVAPVCAYDCFHHNNTSANGIRNRRIAKYGVCLFRSLIIDFIIPHCRYFCNKNPSLLS